MRRIIRRYAIDLSDDLSDKVPSRRYSVLSTQYAVRGTRSVLGTQYSVLRTRLLVLVWLCMATLAPACFSQETPAADPGFKSPVSPEESLQHFKLMPGLQIELVASEPQVIDPVAIRFDEFGKMWVVEMRDYPHGPAEGEEPKSVIKTLEDRDGDGHFETATVFADKLLFVTGVAPWRGGVIVTMAGEVAYMKDTDGDGKVDRRETWYKGFAQENSQLRANHPRFGLDNHVYIANGLRGGSVIDARKPDSKLVPLNGKDFRFDPTTSEYEALTGAGQFGLTFDDFGHRFVCSNRNPLKHIVLEDRDIRRNSRYAPTTAVHDVATAGEASRVFPISRAWTTSNLHAGQFTAACGCLIYRGNGLNKRFYGNGFTCDPTGNFVHRETLNSQGATFSARPGRDGVEFLASPDEWFRAVNLAHGPDGALYVVDMYRAVIEHPQWVPAELKERPDTLLGIDRGRIYRITAITKPEKHVWPNLAKLASNSLVGLLEHPNAWHRETAARLLYERQETSVVNRLNSLVLNGSHPAARVHALWALEGLDSLADEVIQSALRDQDASVRVQAIILAEPRITEPGALRSQVVKLADAEVGEVRYRTALALAPVQDAREVKALRRLLFADARDVWVRRAAAIASGERSVELLETLLDEPPWRGGAPSDAEIELVTEFVTLATSSSEKDAEQRILNAIVGLSSQQVDHRSQGLFIEAFAQSLSRRRTNLMAVLQKAGEEQNKAIGGLFADASSVAADPAQSETLRSEAIRLLTYRADAKQALIDLALTEPARSVRIQAISAISRYGDEEPWKKLLAEFASQAPTLRRAVVNAALGNAKRTTLLLDAIEAGNVKPAELDRTQVNRLLKHPTAELKTRATKLLAAAVPEDRQKVLADYQVVLKMKADSNRGKTIFTKNCATCHKVGDVGVNVAPDISDSRTKQPVQILTDVLQPNRAIDNNYVSYSVVTTDGKLLTGIIASDTASSITLKQPEGKSATLLRTEIEELRSNGISLMPEGLEKDIPPQDMADLVAFIKNWRYLDGRTPLGPSD